MSSPHSSRQQKSGQQKSERAVVSRAVCLSESQEEFEALLAAHIDEFQPQTALEIRWVEDIAEASWRLRRAEAVHAFALANANIPGGKRAAAVLGRYKSAVATSHKSAIRFFLQSRKRRLAVQPQNVQPQTPRKAGYSAR